MADDRSEEDEDDFAPLRVLRPRRLSRSHSQKSFPQMQSTLNEADEATPPKQARLRNDKRSTSGELRIKVGLSFWQHLHSDWISANTQLKCKGGVFSF